MKTAKDSQWWLVEASYCRSMADSRDYKDFNWDAECFRTYCAMQANLARRAGYKWIADEIESAANKSN